jgi:hypothetical protein
MVLHQAIDVMNRAYIGKPLAALFDFTNLVIIERRGESGLKCFS